MSTMKLNPLLLELAKNNAGLRKAAFIPAGQAGGDPAAGGAPPPGGDPSQGGAPPPGGDPSMGGAPPPGGDPAAGGAPPPGGDPAAGGAPPGPPPEMMMMIQQVVTQAVQQAMQAGGQPGAPGAAGPKKSKGGDEVALQLYKTNTFLMAIITAMNKGGLQVEIPPEAMLGPPPGTDPSMAGAMGANVQSPGVAAPGADPNAAAGGQDPNAQPQQQQMQFAPALAPKTAEDTDFDVEDAALSLGIPFGPVGSAPPPPSITEMFPPQKQAQAPAESVQDRANMVMHMIAASRQQRQVVVQ